MRVTAYLSGVGLLLAGLVGGAPAQTIRSIPNSVPGATGGYPTSHNVYTLPPGCGTPSMPYSSTVPGSSVLPPGAMLPGGIGAAPGTPGAPGTGMPGAGAGAAAAAAAPADAAGGAVGERGSDALASAAPQMIGDLISSGYGGVRLNPRFSSTGSYASSSQKYYRVPLGARSGFKIADNESPRPVDRVFVTFNYFNTVNSFGAGQIGLYRELVGFEKTFLDGDASFGARLPFFQGDGAGWLSSEGFGDLTLIGKYAFLNDPTTGDIISGGLAVTVPTGVDTRLFDGSTISSVLLQPWVGFILGMDDFYTHGFSSLIVPTDSKDIVLYTLDLGIGYRLYQNNDRLLSAVIPTFETHVNIPFSNAGPQDLIYFPDMVVLTAGVHFGIAGRSWLTLGAAVPVTGPQLYDAEFVAQFNLRF